VAERRTLISLDDKVSIIGMAGLGMTVHSWPAYCLFSLWAAIYIAAPYLEEPWLEQRYGDAYRQYKSKVPRFLGTAALKSSNRLQRTEIRRR
jgi:hypothetical protein